MNSVKLWVTFVLKKCQETENFRITYTFWILINSFDISEQKQESFLNLLDESIPLSKCHTIEDDDEDDDTTAGDNEEDEDIEKFFNDHYPGACNFWVLFFLANKKF